jgi:anti-sigma B factor antagonist
MLGTRNIDDIIVVNLKDTNRFNFAIAEPVKERLIEFYNKPNVNLVFDLKGITYIDSTGFGALLSALKAASNNYGQLKICNVSSEVIELFRLLQLHHVFEIYDELEACIESFKP